MKPVVGSRCVVMHITPEDAKQVTVVFAGQTWNFRMALDSEGFQAAKIEEGDSVKYFRVLKHHDVSEEPDKIKSILGSVFHNLAMKLVVDTPPESGSDVAEWLAELKFHPCIHCEDES